jgi:short-subunit dehydrogenase
MKIDLKPLADQAIVVTGASSGIGLATAEAAAKAGASVVIAARSTQALEDIAATLQSINSEVLPVSCDVCDRKQVQRLADAAIKRFGRIDTWVNNAGLGLYGRLDEVSDEDSRRLFDINFWGVVNGSLVALPYLKAQGGALINIGSEVSDAYAPLLGMYTATKHAVKGFTDSLRLEIEQLDQAPVAITLIQPTAVDTPFPHHARNYQAQEAKLPTPMIEPKQVADAILEAAISPTRSKRVGWKATLNTMVATMAPAMADRMAAREAGNMQYDEPPRRPLGALYEPSEATGVVGQTHGTGGVEAR